ncbi:hypothetical protein AB0M43_20890 [Longispora sp. NPDC051575]|uniref:hypothetical protein n=1 Tax=Longispora sp. NPDC051575 TaxID=3154943 RepID=UPI00341CDC72
MGDCPGTAWNVISAAGPMSQLAGLIAGFVFAGVIVLLSQPRPAAESGPNPTPGPSAGSGPEPAAGSGPEPAAGPEPGAEATSDAKEANGTARLPALVPFFATFVAMGLNAYVFGLLAGEEPADSCRRVWTAAAVASGMLAIGTVAALCGIVLLIQAYLDRENLSRGDTRQLNYLERLLTVSIRLLAFVAPGLLLQRVYEFLRVWYGGDLHGLHWLWIFAIGVVCCAIVLTALDRNLVRRVLDGPTRNRAGHFDRALMHAGVGTVLYSVTGTALVGFFLGVVPTDWDSTPPFVPWAVAALVTVLPTATIGGYLYAIRGIVRGNGAPPG